MGSSPRVRGTLPEARARLGRVGIIPACAGNTRSPSQCSWSAWDHPRVCGEHDPEEGTVFGRWGSSPRVRGTPDTVHEDINELGIIPACAGNTDCSRCRPRLSRDHPRVCGEHVALDFGELQGQGSSPRVRGTRFEGRELLEHHGIIPACAGNTRPWPTRCARARDHPRVCGEHLSAAFNLPFAEGSSPRVRGTQTARSRSRQAARDHPRVCGEHGGWSFAQREGVGSSPRVRGTR